jgi:hypothetical protein
MFKTVAESFDEPVSVLVNNAGITVSAPQLAVFVS